MLVCVCVRVGVHIYGMCYTRAFNADGGCIRSDGLFIFVRMCPTMSLWFRRECFALNTIPMGVRDAEACVRVCVSVRVRGCMCVHVIVYAYLSVSVCACAY